MTQWNSAQHARRFVEAYADAILRLCLTYSLTREDAQDICQDIFLTLLEDSRQFENETHERAFVLRCAINIHHEAPKHHTYDLCPEDFYMECRLT